MRCRAFAESLLEQGRGERAALRAGTCGRIMPLIAVAITNALFVCLADDCSSLELVVVLLVLFHDTFSAGQFVGKLLSVNLTCECPRQGISGQ